ncbi:hypothetical protein ACFU96_45960 [Streptomyces sp. NPDC057620]|uniref:hypothetical protein n=1 Tax=Streptomyces sp. NPDC057620 TaxID=3346185 RepID=UPI0036C32EC1
MNWDTLWPALIGAVAALAGGVLSYYLVARRDSKDDVAAEAAALKALGMELEVAVKMAKEKTATPLPTYMLWAVMPSIHHMATGQRNAFIEYSEKVLRYNGLVHRLVLFSAAKRVREDGVGVEKPGEEHSDPVITTGEKAYRVLIDHLQTPRFRGQAGSAVASKVPGTSPSP